MITIVVYKLHALIVPQEVKEYSEFLIDFYGRIPVTEDQWPAVKFQEYIKLSTVLKVEDFMNEDDCTKAMMNGNLKTIQGMKEPIAMEKVSHKSLWYAL